MLKTWAWKDLNLRPIEYAPDTSIDKHGSQYLDHMVWHQAYGHLHCQAFAGKFIHRIRNAKFDTNLGTILHKIITPEMVGK